MVGARPKDLVYIVEIALLCNLSYLTIIDSITSMVKKNLSFFSVAHISFFVFQARKVSSLKLHQRSGVKAYRIIA